MELTLLTPLLLLSARLRRGSRTLAEGRLQVDDAAAQAARAATVAASASGASAAAQQAAAASLASDRVTCSRLTVTTDSSSFVPVDPSGSR